MPDMESYRAICWPIGQLRSYSSKPLVNSGQLKQQIHAGSMTTLSPEAFAGHTPMMQQYLRFI